MEALSAEFESLVGPLRAELHRIYGETPWHGYPPVKIGLLAPTDDAPVRLWVQTPLRYVPGLTPDRIPDAVRMLQRETPWIPPVCP